jgi:hypothetical protein
VRGWRAGRSQWRCRSTSGRTRSRRSYRILGFIGSTHDPDVTRRFLTDTLRDRSEHDPRCLTPFGKPDTDRAVMIDRIEYRSLDIVVDTTSLSYFSGSSPARSATSSITASPRSSASACYLLQGENPALQGGRESDTPHLYDYWERLARCLRRYIRPHIGTIGQYQYSNPIRAGIPCVIGEDTDTKQQDTSESAGQNHSNPPQDRSTGGVALSHSSVCKPEENNDPSFDGRGKPRRLRRGGCHPPSVAGRSAASASSRRQSRNQLFVVQRPASGDREAKLLPLRLPSYRDI